MENFAPIIVFAFNRPESFLNTVNSLLINKEAKDSDLFIFIDGPRNNTIDDVEKVKKTKELAFDITGFKIIKIISSKTNKGLAESIIDGVTRVINIYGKAIVIEDDLEVASNFLSFINQGLIKYKDENKIFSICGYSNKITIPKDFVYDAYFCTRSSSWGWGTWKNRWNSVDWDLNNWDRIKKTKIDFNSWGGSDCFKMLRSVKNRQGNSWAIRFCYTQFIQDKLSLFPTISKVKNRGFDGSGINCKRWSRFKCIFDNTNNIIFIFPQKIVLNEKIYKSAMKYNALIIRIYSRIMYVFTDI